MKVETQVVSITGSPNSAAVTRIHQALSRQPEIKLHSLEPQQLEQSEGLNKDQATLFIVAPDIDIKRLLSTLKKLAEDFSRKYFLFVGYQAGAVGLSVELSLVLGDSWRFAASEPEMIRARIADAIYFLDHADKLKVSVGKIRTWFGDGGWLQSSERKEWINADYYLDSIVRSSTDAIIGVDMQDMIRFWSKGAEKLYGHEAADVIGKTVFLLAPDVDTNEVAAMHDRVYRNEEIRDYETVHRRKNGSRVDVALNISPVFDSEGKMGGISLIARDISGRKRAEHEIEKQKQKLEAINKELKDFAYIISHDLKAPLRGISFVADWLIEDYADKLDEEGKENLRLLQSRARRMSQMIDGVLSYSRVETQQEESEPVDLNVLLPEVIDLLAPPPHIRITLDPSFPDVMCSPVRIGQIFQNLLSNAIRYMDKAQAEIHIGWRDEGDKWRFSVRDNGPGIDQAHFEKIFQIFQTLAPRDKVESTGVGLTIVRKIVQLYGGEIWLESVLGEGTTFYFTFPKDLSA
jgi:two-component system sensor kinase FixL